MGGVHVDAGGHGGRRSLDSEINMIPMIDFLMVTISFLLLTAVWTHMSRLNADAQVPGPEKIDVPLGPPDKQLHIEMRSPDKFVLTWKQAGTVLSVLDVPRREVVSVEGSTRVVRFPDLAAKVASEWTSVGAHRDATDPKLDQAVLHTGNETPYAAIIGVVDAVYQSRRPLRAGARVDSAPAFNVTFSVN